MGKRSVPVHAVIGAVVVLVVVSSVLFASRGFGPHFTNSIWVADVRMGDSVIGEARVVGRTAMGAFVVRWTRGSSGPVRLHIAARTSLAVAVGRAATLAGVAVALLAAAAWGGGA